MELRNFLKESFGLEPLDFRVFEDAFTHSSAKTEERINDYERLELLGDSVVNCIITLLLHDLNISVKESCNKRKELISGRSLSYMTKKLKLDNFLILGKGCDPTDSMFGDLYESFVAAIFLNDGFLRAKQFVADTLWKEFIHNTLPSFTDYKTKLQEFIQTSCKEKIVYESSKIQGDDFGFFEVSVFLGGVLKGVGKGQSVKKAEQDAAKNALLNLNVF